MAEVNTEPEAPPVEGAIAADKLWFGPPNSEGLCALMTAEGWVVTWITTEDLRACEMPIPMDGEFGVALRALAESWREAACELDFVHADIGSAEAIGLRRAADELDGALARGVQRTAEAVTEPPNTAAASGPEGFNDPMVGRIGMPSAPGDIPADGWGDDIDADAVVRAAALIDEGLDAVPTEVGA